MQVHLQSQEVTQGCSKQTRLLWSYRARKLGGDLLGLVGHTKLWNVDIVLIWCQTAMQHPNECGLTSAVLACYNPPGWSTELFTQQEDKELWVAIWNNLSQALKSVLTNHNRSTDENLRVTRPCLMPCLRHQ